MNKINQLDNNILKWFAIYTKPRAEKKVTSQLEDNNYEVYLPLKKELRQWKDRKKQVEIPLFSSYVFVKIIKKQYYELPKQILGFVKFVSIGGNLIAVRDEEIESIKKILSHSEIDIETTNERFELNDNVKIKSGILKGQEGKLIEFQGKYKIAIRIYSLGTSLIVKINKNTITKIV